MYSIPNPAVRGRFRERPRHYINVPNKANGGVNRKQGILSILARRPSPPPPDPNDKAAVARMQIYYMAKQIFGPRNVNDKPINKANGQGYPPTLQKDTKKPEEGLSGCRGLVANYMNSGEDGKPGSPKTARLQASKEQVVEMAEFPQNKAWGPEQRIPYKIINSVEKDGYQYYVVKTHQGDPFTDVIQAEEMKTNWPQLVTEFNESQRRCGKEGNTGRNDNGQETDSDGD